MKIETFTQNTKKALERALVVGRSLLLEPLPDKVVVRVYRDARENPVVDLFSKVEIVNYFYIEGKVPLWIDLNVGGIENGKTIIHCLASNDYVEDGFSLKNITEGMSPYHVLGPGLPSPNYDF